MENVYQRFENKKIQRAKILKLKDIAHPARRSTSNVSYQPIKIISVDVSPYPRPTPLVTTERQLSY